MERTYYRRYPRVRTNIGVEATLDAASQRARASTLGGGGLFIGVAQQIAPGTEMTLQFRPAKHLPVISVRSQVRYQIPEEGVGIEFIEIDPRYRDMILRLILHRMGEKRRYPRVPLATQVESPEGMLIGFSKDISVGGMFIELTKPVSVGSRIHVLFHLGDGTEEAVKAEAEVLYAVLKLGIGVRFLDIAPADLGRIEAFTARGDS